MFAEKVFDKESTNSPILDNLWLYKCQNSRFNNHFNLNKSKQRKPYTAKARAKIRIK